MKKINTGVRKEATAPTPQRSVKNRYARLIRSLSQKDTKVVLSMGSGGIRMFAHLSVLRFLEKLGVENRISEIWGSSGGALVGLFYSMGLHVDEIEKEADTFFRGHHLKLTPSIFSVAKSLLREAVYSKHGPTEIKGFHNIHQILQDLLGRIVETHKEKYPWYCLAYNLDKNRTEILTSTQIPDGVYRDLIYRTNPIDAVIASSSIPVLFVPKVIQDHNGKRTYTDGGTGEEIPTVSIHRKWVQDREFGLEKRKRLLVLAVDLGTDLSSMNFFEKWLIRKIPAFQYIRMTVHLSDLMRRARIAEQKRSLARDPNVELWEINLNLGRYGFLDLEAIPALMKTSEREVPEEFLRLNDSLLT